MQKLAAGRMYADGLEELKKGGKVHFLFYVKAAAKLEDLDLR
jgi:hypothetical protein